jgi:NAD(P)-dependent dehydrogenase (short-subunit alcohol dehydrogenase family)
MPSIKDQYVLIIGGTSGIGFAAAHLALEQGARVAIASSNPERISSALNKLQSSFPSAQVTTHQCDLSQLDIESRLLALFNAATDDGKKLLDHIIHTAIPPFTLTPFEQITAEEIQKAGHFHCLAPLMIGKVAPKFLNPGYKSSVIFTSGQIAQKPIKGWTVQAAYATALYGITKALALDVAPRRVNCVSPGATITELWGPSTEEREKRADMMKDAMLLGKVGDPEEVAECYTYLMRNWNATGSIVSSDGGNVLK